MKLLKKFIRSQPKLAYLDNQYSDALEQQINEFLAQTVNYEHSQKLKGVFQMLDYNKNGKIKLTDLINVLENSGQRLDLSDFYNLIGANPRSEMSFNEFMVSTLSIR